MLTQLGECCRHMAKVVGSSPIHPTTGLQVKPEVFPFAPGLDPDLWENPAGFARLMV